MTPRSIPLAQVVPHPRNPRLLLREGVVEAIAAQIRADGYQPAHAILVRPVGDTFETVSGHHRVEGAKRAGLTEILAWVREMSDDEAFMQLVLANAQSELSPLERGIHALMAVPTATGGRGKEGGLSKYARGVSTPRETLKEWRTGAEVFAEVKPGERPPRFWLDKVSHLASIHALEDRTLWPVLVRFLADRGWSVKDTAQMVEGVKGFDVPGRWAGVFLDRVRVVERYLDTREFSPSTVAKLCALADSVDATIDSHDVDRVTYRAEFRDWLAKHAGGTSWDPRQIIAYRQRLEAKLAEAESDGTCSWLLGSWEQHIGSLSDGSVKLLLTDPPYGIDFQSNYRLDRSKPPKHAKIAGDDGTEALATCLYTFMPKLAADAHVLVFCHWSNEPEVRAVLAAAGLTLRGSLVWAKNNTGMGDLSTTFAPKHERILHAVKGSPTLFAREPDVLEADRVASDRHPTEKPVDLLERLIRATTVEGELVADPFGGVASTVVAARSTKRRVWSCEVDEGYYAEGRRRLGDG